MNARFQQPLQTVRRGLPVPALRTCGAQPPLRPTSFWKGGGTSTAVELTNMKDASSRKANLLSQEIEHIDIASCDARPLIQSMSRMSFTSRDLAGAAEIFNNMLRDESCSIILTIAGSTSAGGCMKLYADLIKYNMVD